MDGEQATARVRLLGPIDVVSASGVVHASGSALRRTLLALLALRASKVVSADWLLEHAWANAPPESGLRALRFHISQLRRELPNGELIETRPGGYRLAVTPAQVDVLAVDSLVRAARADRTAGEVVVRLEQVLSLWRGTPFVDGATCAMLDDEAQRLDELRLTILGEYYVARLESGEADEIIPDLVRLLAEHPLRESLWAVLISAQDRTGRRADALRSFERLRRTLAETSGLSPSAELQELQARVLREEPQRAPATIPTRQRPSGTVTFLFTDIEGSTRLWEEEPAAMHAAVARHDELLRDSIANGDGAIFSTGGDGLAASFQRAAAAIGTAVDAQRRFAAEPWPKEIPLRVRMGIHTGEAEERDGDYFGPPVNRAARAMAVAAGGEIVVTAAAASVAEHPPGVRLVALGPTQLTGIAEPIDLYLVDADGLPTVLRPRIATRALRGNLPAPATPLIDSEERLDAVRTLLQAHRLVTLTGTGGVGKSRMAVELGWSALDRFDGGVWLVELAPVANPDAVLAAVASTLSIAPQSGLTLVESTVDWFRNRELLLILDNCEHILKPVRELVARLLASCPGVKVVVTSREPLAIAGEHVVPVSVLNTESDAVVLFVDRATAADSSYVFSNVDQGIVAEICRRLDGLPLAIELAAARVRSMAPADLLVRLEDRFKLLRGGSRSGVADHETLQATVTWSYQLLSEHERVAFSRMAVFAGGFDLLAAEAICADDAIDAAEVVDLLRNLVDKSLVVAERDADGTRYRMLETLRQFGAERLDLEGMAATARDRHLHHYVDVAERADTLFRSSLQVRGAAIFDREWDNLRGAHQWAVLRGDLVMAERLVAGSRLHAMSRMRREHGDWVDQTISLGDSERAASPDTFAQAAWWAWRDEDAIRAWELLDRGIELAVSLDHPSVALCLAYATRNEHGRVPDPFTHLERLASKLDLDREWWVLIELAEAASTEDPASQPDHVTRLQDAADRVRAPLLVVAAALARGHLAITAEPADFTAALGLYQHGLDTARLSGDLLAEGDCMRAVAMATAGLEPDDADGPCRDALAALYELRYWTRIWQLLETVGLVLVTAGRLEAAAIVAGNLDANHEPFGYEHALGFGTRTRERLRSDPRSGEWMGRGAAMSRHQIVEYALAEISAATSRPHQER